MNQPVILVVDDDYVARSITSSKLKSFADVDVAVDGLDAMERVSARNYDALVVDLGMPMIDGIDLVRILRSRSSTKNIPIVVVSASEDPAHFKGAMANGATCTFAKPLRWTEFTQQLRHLLVRTEAVAELPKWAAPTNRPQTKSVVKFGAKGIPTG